jgi:hypothetical protein
MPSSSRHSSRRRPSSRHSSRRRPSSRHSSRRSSHPLRQSFRSPRRSREYRGGNKTTEATYTDTPVNVVDILFKAKGTLTSLTISRAAIDDNGVAVIKSALLDAGTQLKHLILQTNGLEPQHVLTICQSLETNRTLEVLDLRNNICMDITNPYTLEQVQEWIRANETIKHVFVMTYHTNLYNQWSQNPQRDGRIKLSNTLNEPLKGPQPKYKLIFHIPISNEPWVFPSFSSFNVQEKGTNDFNIQCVPGQPCNKMLEVKYTDSNSRHRRSLRLLVCRITLSGETLQIGLGKANGTYQKKDLRSFVIRPRFDNPPNYECFTFLV